MFDSIINAYRISSGCKPQIKIKLVSPNSQLPTKEMGNAGYDLYSCESYFIPPKTRKLIKTGIAISMPDGYYGHICDRSGMAYKQGATVLAGVIDPAYAGILGIVLYNTSDENIIINIGDRPAQIIFSKFEEPLFQEVEELEDTIRGEKGFGSSGK